MKRLYSIMAAALLTTAASAQETYDNAQLANKDLNGTARYVGMGGAMEALGADISTMSTNPAGVGLIRRSTISGSFGLNSQSGAEDMTDFNKTNMSFDQIGFVYAMRGTRSSVNFGFNYSKSRNFDQILTAAGRLNGASQNKQSGMKNYNGIYKLRSKDGTLYSQDATCSQLDYLYSNVLLGDGNSRLTDNKGNVIGDGTDGFLVRPTTNADGSTTYDPTFYNATGYQFGRGTTGYIGQYDFNISGNANDRFYWGLTFGLYDVHYDATTRYMENIVDGTKDIGNMALQDERKITGTGFDVKAGIIFRPVEESPFRIGLYVHTPTWYDLNTKNYTRLNNNLDKNYGAHDYGEVSESYDFKFNTPWRFGASFGHTVGNYLAIGATYEYADYSTCDIRVNDGSEVDYWGGVTTVSHSDGVMKQNIKKSLKGVHTIKLGVEFKPEKNFAVRLGYNYLSSMYSDKGVKDGYLNSYGTYYSSTTDYTNWKSTNRITAGVGYNYRNWNIDLAYQYSQTDGDFHPFMKYVDSENNAYNNVCDAVKVSNKRNQLLLTLGYRF